LLSMMHIGIGKAHLTVHFFPVVLQPGAIVHDCLHGDAAGGCGLKVQNVPPKHTLNVAAD
jgi:hypothetical protein